MAVLNTHESTTHLSKKTNSGLLFQFILAEFLDLNAGLFELRKDLETVPCPHELKLFLSDLLGSHSEHQYAWEVNHGKLSKIKKYSTLISETSELKRQHLRKLAKATQKLWEISAKCLQKLPKTHQSSWLRFSQEIENTKKMISCAIDHFYDDENVLLFLLQNHLQFDNIFGKYFVAGKFHHFFDNDMMKTQTFLIERYQLRGFNKLEPLIKQKIEELSKK